MKRAVLCFTLLAVAVAFTGCKKKEPAPSDQLNAITKKVDAAAKDASQAADKAAADAKKAGEEAKK